MSESPQKRSPEEIDGRVLIAAVFVAAICGLIYELLAGALSSYLLGDSVTQFSLVVGVFLSTMGVGSYLSRFIERSLLSWLIGVELAVGLIGGALTLVGFVAFAFTDIYAPVLLSLVGVVGVLVGMEIPLVVRLLKGAGALRLTLARVLSADYVGALVASLAFPFILAPHVGLVRAGFLAGLANVLVAGVVLWKLGERARHRNTLKVAVWASALVMVVGVVFGSGTTRLIEDQLYSDQIIYSESSRANRIVITRWRDDIRLFLGGQLQFSSIDEYRYHEALVHPAISLREQRTPSGSRVLVLGGGDGMAVREILKHERVSSIDLVDLDPRVVGLFRDRPLLASLNGGSLSHERVTIHHEDAMKFLEQRASLYDVVVMDLPDPSAPGLGKLYSRAFFRLVGRHLAPDGVLALQATSPFRSREAFWSIAKTVEAAQWGPADADHPQSFHVAPYHTIVPTFGTWGFVLASPTPFDTNTIEINVPTRYLTTGMLPGLFEFPADMGPLPVPISELDRPHVVDLYRRGYHQYYE